MQQAQLTYLDLIGFGPSGWGMALLAAATITFLVALCGFVVGATIGAFIAWARTSGNAVLQIFADAYTTILRGIPDLLVIYLFYFGGSVALTKIGRLFGASHFIEVPAFASATVAIGIISGAYQAEVFRGAYQALHRGELEAARAMGMHTWLMFRRISGPQVLRFAIPGLGNLWQLILKDSALVSVTGLMELLHQSAVAAGTTYRPFDFYLTAMLLYLIISWASSYVFIRLEHYSMRGVRGSR